MNIHVNVTGTSTRFFNVLADALVITDGTTVPATDFFDDTGTAATEFPIVTNGYYNLYVNGVLQEGGAYSVDADEITFNTITGTISAGTPIILEAVDLVTVV
nr:DUF4183 domain-containing protein [Bacillus sp. FJAT-50079]